MSEKSFFSELHKRKVVQAAAIYGAVAWGVTEVLVTIVEQLFLPQWVSTLAVIFFVVGFPIAMFLSWTFDLTTDGIHRTTVSSRRGTASIMVSMVLLVAGTAGLFFLIKPGLQLRETSSAAVAVAPGSIAVLPFANAGVSTENTYLVGGLSDELRDQLSRVSDLRMAARSSSVAAVDQGLDALSTAQKLGVASLLEGNVRRQGNILRVSVQLISGKDGLAIWSETFDRGPNEFLSLQQAIVEAVVTHLLPGSDVVVAGPATRNVNANELMLLARHYEQQVRDSQIIDMNVLAEAVRLYREATEADPESALAHSRLASALLHLDELEAAEAPIFKALAINPNLSEVQKALGDFYWAKGLPEFSTAYARAVELNPNNADALHAYASWALLTPEIKGKGVDQLFRRAMELDPLSLSRHGALGEFYGLFGDREGVREVIRGVDALFDNVDSHRLNGRLYELIGEVDKAIAWTIRARDLEPDNIDHSDQLASYYASIGDFETALRLEPEPGLGLLFQMRRYQELIDNGEFLMIDQPDDMGVRYLLAFAYAAAGQSESAIHVLSSTGLPDTLFDNTMRSVSEIEAFTTLFNALAAIGRPDTDEMAQSLAEWFDLEEWWGDKSWIAVYRGCTLAIMGKTEEALEQFTKVHEGSRILRDPNLRDLYCFQQFVGTPEYQGVIEHQEQRKASLRERLPATLAEFGVSLD